MPNDDELKGELRDIIKMEGFHLTVSTTRKALAARVEEDFDGEDDRVRIRGLIEEVIKGLIYENPSLLDNLRKPHVVSGVGKKKKIRPGEKKHKSHHHKKEKKTRSSSKKSRKDDDGPAKPKKPMTAYFMWQNSVREKMKAEHPGLSATELVKKMSELWNGMAADDPERVKVDADVEADKVRYEKEVAAFIAEHGKDALGKGHKSKKTESDGPTPPKRPMTAYFIWAIATREEFKKKYPEDATNVAALAKHQGEAWGELADDAPEKAEAQAKHKELQDTYDKELAKFVEEHGEDALRKSGAKRARSSTGKRPPAKRRKKAKGDGFLVDEDATTTEMSSEDDTSSSSSSSSSSDSDSDSGSSSSSSGSSSSSSSSSSS